MMGLALKSKYDKIFYAGGWFTLLQAIKYLAKGETVAWAIPQNNDSFYELIPYNENYLINELGQFWSDLEIKQEALLPLESLLLLPQKSVYLAHQQDQIILEWQRKYPGTEPKNQLSEVVPYLTPLQLVENRGEDFLREPWFTIKSNFFQVQMIQKFLELGGDLRQTEIERFVFEGDQLIGLEFSTYEGVVHSDKIYYMGGALPANLDLVLPDVSQFFHCLKTTIKWPEFFPAKELSENRREKQARLIFLPSPLPGPYAFLFLRSMGDDFASVYLGLNSDQFYRPWQGADLIQELSSFFNYPNLLNLLPGQLSKWEQSTFWPRPLIQRTGLIRFSNSGALRQKGPREHKFIKNIFLGAELQSNMS